MRHQANTGADIRFKSRGAVETAPHNTSEAALIRASKLFHSILAHYVGLTGSYPY